MTDDLRARAEAVARNRAAELGIYDEEAIKASVPDVMRALATKKPHPTVRGLFFDGFGRPGLLQGHELEAPLTWAENITALAVYLKIVTPLGSPKTKR